MASLSLFLLSLLALHRPPPIPLPFVTHEVASIIQPSSAPMLSTLFPLSAPRLHHPASSIRLPASSIRPYASSIRPPASSIRPSTSSIRLPASSIRLPSSSVRMTAVPERDRKRGRTAPPPPRPPSRLSKGAARARVKLVRALSAAMIELKIPPAEAVAYAEALAAQGVTHPRELPRLQKPLLDLCEVRRGHRRLLAASGVLLGAEAEAGEVQAEAEAEEGEGEEEVVEGEQVEELRVGEGLDGLRVDAALKEAFPQLSRSYFGELLAEGRVTVDGAAVKKSARLAAGAALRVRLRPSAELRVVGEPIELDVLYEDEHLLAVHKPAGMVVHPAPSHWNGTFANALVHRLAGRAAAAAASLPDAFGDTLRPGIVHRLDRFTSGVLLAAKTTGVQRQLLAAFAERRVFKVYLAVCVGFPADATEVTSPVGRHRTDRMKMAVVPVEEGGRHAASYVHRIASDGRLSLVAVRIGTGRTHQIRVHLQHLRCPVLGDPTYGDANWNKKERAERPLLHAFTLRIAHPLTGDPLSFVAPPPADLQAAAAPLLGCNVDQVDEEVTRRVHAVMSGALNDFSF